MIRKMRLVNFKSFDNVEIDFSKNNKEIKKNIFIYGENGSGKSNLVSAFSFLQDSLNTLNLQSLLENLWLDKKIDVSIYQNLQSKYLDSSLTKGDLSSYRQMENETPTEVMFEFSFEQKNSIVYSLKFDSERILEEIMSFPVEKNNIIAFKMSEGYIHRSLFKNETFNKQMRDLVKQLWGKHSFLAIVQQQLLRNNAQYSSNNIHHGLINIIEKIAAFRILTKISLNEDTTTSKLAEFTSENSLFTRSLTVGSVAKNKLALLDKTEFLLNDFFSSLYSDIKRVFYKMTAKNDMVHYKLFFNKMIGGKIISIPYDQESTGTLKLLELFPYIMELRNHNLVVIDEADTGIHDILFETIIKLAREEGNGQLIMTTHNTRLLASLEPSEAYVIKVDRNGHKTIGALSDYAIRLQKNHNLSYRYLSGAFGGVPVPGYFTLKESGEEYDSSKKKEK